MPNNASVTDIKPLNQSVVDTKPVNSGISDTTIQYLETKTINAGQIMMTFPLITYPTAMTFNAVRL